MAAALMTTAEIRQHVETGITDDALTRLIGIAEIDIRSHAGALGEVAFTNVLFRAGFTAGDTQAEPVADAVITVADTDVVLTSLTWNGARLVIGSEPDDDVSAAEVFATAGAAGRHSLYVTHRTATAELPSSLYDAASVNPNAAWDVPQTRRYKHLRDTLTAAVVDGEEFELVVATAKARLPLTSAVEQGRAVRRDALIDLVSLAVETEVGARSTSVGDYQESFRNKDETRGEILQRLILSTGEIVA